MAVASQKMTLMRFLLRMRGLFTEAPRMLLPVMKMPQAAPSTHRKSALLVPMAAIEKGLRRRGGGERARGGGARRGGLAQDSDSGGGNGSVGDGGVGNGAGAAARSRGRRT